MKLIAAVSFTLIPDEIFLEEENRECPEVQKEY